MVDDHDVNEFRAARIFENKAQLRARVLAFGPQVLEYAVKPLDGGARRNIPEEILSDDRGWRESRQSGLRTAVGGDDGVTGDPDGSKRQRIKRIRRHLR